MAKDGARDVSSAEAALQRALTGVPRDEVREHYLSRVKDKRVQLANPDRPRPKAGHGRAAARKLRAREKKARSQLGHPASQSRSDASAPLRKRTKREARPRGIEGMDENLSYAALLPLSQLWTSYFTQFLGLMRPQTDMQSGEVKLLPNSAMLKLEQPAPLSPTTPAPPAQWRINDGAITGIQQQACKADLVGATIEVARASNPTLVGVRGLVAKETEHTFVVAHREKGDPGAAKPQSRKAARAFKVVPKHNTTLLLRVSLPPAEPNSTPIQHLDVPLQGNQMEGNMVTRATKKWKQKRTMDF